MGERRARIKYYGAKAKPIVEYTKIYLSALRALINSVALNELYVKIPNKGECPEGINVLMD